MAIAAPEDAAVAPAQGSSDRVQSPSVDAAVAPDQGSPNPVVDAAVAPAQGSSDPVVDAAVAPARSSDRVEAPSVADAAVAPAQGSTDPVQAPSVDEGGVVIKTWGFLRDATDALGTRAQDVLSVQADLKTFDQDLDAQRDAWQQAKAKLEEDNRALQSQIAALQAGTPAHVDGGFAAELDAVKAAMSAAALQAKQERDSAAGRKKVLKADISATTQQLTNERDGALAEHESMAVASARFLDEKTQLQAKIQELQGMVAGVKSEDAAKAAEALRNETTLQDKVAQLKAQQAATAADLPRVEKMASRAGFLRKEIAASQQGLAGVHEGLAQAEGACLQQRADLQAVLAAERKKVEARKEELASCAGVHAQNMWLHQKLASCGIAVPAAPAGR